MAKFDGNIILVLKFMYGNITPYIRKYGKHPVTGALLKQEDLIPLIFHKNAEGFGFFCIKLYFNFLPFFFKKKKSV